MLNKFFWPNILRTPDYKKYYFKQDRATFHTAIAIQTLFGNIFGKKILNKDFWPPGPQIKILVIIFYGVILMLECIIHFAKNTRRSESKYHYKNRKHFKKNFQIDFFENPSMLSCLQVNMK